jgi:hypothetical protein
MALALLCFVLFLAVGIALMFVPGLALVGVLFVLAAFAAAVWAVVALLTGGGVSVVLRWPRKPELLGPGGPDDPDAADGPTGPRDASADVRQPERTRS